MSSHMKKEFVSGNSLIKERIVSIQERKLLYILVKYISKQTLGVSRTMSLLTIYEYKYTYNMYMCTLIESFEHC